MSRGRHPNIVSGLLVDHRRRVLAGHHDLRDRGWLGTPGPAACRRPASGRRCRSSIAARCRSARSRGVRPGRLAGRSAASGRAASNRSLWLSSISALPRNRAAVASAKWKRLDDHSLGLGVEVHQRVAADEQVEPGDRRVLDEVVAAEDHRAAQVLAERRSGRRRARSTARRSSGGHRLDGLGVVGRRRAPAASASSSTSVA